MQPGPDGYIHYSVFEYTYLLFWNIFWTLLPVIALGLFDRDIGWSKTW